MVHAAAGQVDKVIRIVASSPESFEDAARRAVSEATKSIRDLRTATVTRSDIVVRDATVVHYRVEIELAFQLDRQRLSADRSQNVRVHRALIVANRTLASPDLEQIVADRIASGPAEFHILVPIAPSAPEHGTTNSHDTGLDDENDDDSRDGLASLNEATDRLDAFNDTFAHLGDTVTSELSLGDPVTATRRAMERSSFDEIIVSTLPPGVSRWLRLDLPHRMERAFSIPVTTLVQD